MAQTKLYLMLGFSDHSVDFQRNLMLAISDGVSEKVKARCQEILICREYCSNKFSAIGGVKVYN